MNMIVQTLALAPDPGSPPLKATSLREVERCMRQALSRLEVTGPLAGIVTRHLDTGGKRLRAQLALRAGEAMGLDAHNTVIVASICELLHNAAVVHDDIQDGDRIRRHRPTIWAQYGRAQAINAGDLLLMLPTLMLGELETRSSVRWALAERIAQRCRDAVRGQSLEMTLLAERRFDRASYERAVRDKTGALMALPVELAAILADRAPSEVDELAELFFSLGAMFQLQDDWLDLYGDKGRGRIGNDLREGKVSALAVAHLERHPEDEDELFAVLDAPRVATTDVAVERWVERFATRGARDAVVCAIQAHASRLRTASALRALPALAQLSDRIIDWIVAPLDRVDGGARR